MGTFIILAITISMIFTYAKSLFMTKKRSLETQKDLIKTFDDAKKDGLSEEALKSVTIATGFFMTLYYLIFYIITAVIIDTTWSMYVAAIFGVLAVRSFLVAIDFVKSKKLVKTSIFSKIASLTGFIYTIYFFFVYVNRTFTSMEILYLGIGLIFGAVLILLFRFLHNKRNTN